MAGKSLCRDFAQRKSKRKIRSWNRVNINRERCWSCKEHSRHQHHQPLHDLISSTNFRFISIFHSEAGERFPQAMIRFGIKMGETEFLLRTFGEWWNGTRTHKLSFDFHLTFFPVCVQPGSLEILRAKMAAGFRAFGNLRLNNCDANFRR